MLRILLLFGALVVGATALPANPPPSYYAFTPAARAVYQRIFRLELDGAQEDLDRFRTANPTNLVTHHLESYLDFFRLYLRGDPDLDASLAERYDRRIAGLEAGEENSPYYRYALAEARLHRSLIHLRFERPLAAFRELNRAHKLLRANARAFPDFLPTFKDLGLLHAAVGSIPPQYKWGVELLSSLNGTIAEGREEIRRAMQDTESPFHLETQVLYAYLELHLADEPATAWRQVSALSLRPRTNALHCFVLANLAMRNGKNETALRLLEAQPRGGNAEDFPYLDFMLGLTKLRTLDPTARVHFQSFNLRYAGRQFKEEARQKIAWSYLLEGDSDRYLRAMEKVGESSRAGGDENAAREATRRRPPHLGLLRARLLCDGNYCTRARAELDAIDPAGLATEDQLEYLYRTGRVLEGLEDYAGALSFYGKTVAQGRDHPAYFACKAALQAGMIEEKRGDPAAASRHYETCLSLKPQEYRTGLHLLAKAGLNRVR